MTPPTNDNPPPRKPGYFNTPRNAAESLFSLAGLGVIYVSGYLYLSPGQWRGMWLTIGVAVVFMFATAAYRLIRHGRA